MGLCSESGTQLFEWSQCCSGTARQKCPAINEPIENYCCGSDPGESNEVAVSPSTTTTYQCTATTDETVFDFSGCAPSEFQIDIGNNGTWDSTLAAPGCVSTLGVNQSTQVVSPAWTAVSGTHAVRLCANMPLTENEGVTDNNCGAEYVFTVSNPTQCQDGIDNNGNNLIDTADPACTSGGDTTEEAHSAAALSLTTNQSTVKAGGTVTLTWSATEVVADSCVISSTSGGTWAVSGSGGTQVSGTVGQETTYTLTCTSIQTGGPVEVKASVKIAPRYEER